MKKIRTSDAKFQSEVQPESFPTDIFLKRSCIRPALAFYSPTEYADVISPNGLGTTLRPSDSFYIYSIGWDLVGDLF